MVDLHNIIGVCHLFIFYICLIKMNCCHANGSPVKDKLETLVLVRGITVFTVRVVGVLIVGLLTRLAVLATWETDRVSGSN